MINIQIDTHEVTQALDRLSRASSDLRQPLDEIGQTIEDNIALLFRDAESPEGEPWADLKHRVGKPLNDTGRLKNSFTHNVSGNSVEIGTNVEYAITHQKGASKGQYAAGVPWGDIPARPFLPDGSLPAAWEADVLDIIIDHLSVAIER
jgi:phage virion morphogenesis protein